ncbi:MAG: Ig-like domain-containing protein [Clostridiales Family XIII bacterium]|nr:Ig-like domain-containing protein [Clostridiales Family XIII bacterium]
MATAPSPSLKSIYVKKGDTIKITGRFLAKGDKVKFYKSSKPSVATISKKGTLKAKKAGVTTVTIKTKKGKKDTIKVHVVKKSKAASKLTLPKTKVMFTKDVERLDLKVSPAKSTSTIKWTSSNKAIATVNAAGYITAKKEGAVKITAKAGKKKATTKLTVKVLVKAASIAVTPTRGAIIPSGKLKVNATLTPEDPNIPSNDIIEWTSSNKNIATVSSKGVVTAINPGTVKITAKAVKSNKKASATLTVYSNTIPAGTVKITPGERFKTDFTLYGLDSNNGLTYSSSNKSIATVDSGGYVQANFRNKSTGKVNTGITTIEATTVDGDTASIDVMVTSEPTIVDLSKWQGDIDWSQSSKAIDLAILRVSYGADTKIEPKYKTYADSCDEYGVPFGVYSYCLYKSKSAALKEATTFYEQATSGGRVPLFFVLDIEEAYIKKAYTEAYIAKLRELAAADGITRLKIGIYIGHHLYEKLKINMATDLDNPKTVDFVWIPRYNLPNNGAMASSAKTPIYTCDMWQYSSGAYLPGVKGKVDVNTLYNPEGSVLTKKDSFSFDWLIAGSEAG